MINYYYRVNLDSKAIVVGQVFMESRYGQFSMVSELFWVEINKFLNCVYFYNTGSKRKWRSSWRQRSKGMLKITKKDILGSKFSIKSIAFNPIPARLFRGSLMLEGIILKIFFPKRNICKIWLWQFNKIWALPKAEQGEGVESALLPSTNRINIVFFFLLRDHMVTKACLVLQDHQEKTWGKIIFSYIKVSSKY